MIGDGPGLTQDQFDRGQRVKFVAGPSPDDDPPDPAWYCDVLGDGTSREDTMPDINDGDSVEVKGSAAKPYVLRNVGGVYSCTCPAWRNQSTAIEKRTCKHLRKYRGEAAEKKRLGGSLPTKAKPTGARKEAPPLLLAQTWDSGLNLKDWWMSEKLDGVRAYWDGKRFLSRLGNEYHAPKWFVAGLPKTPLDGELWIDRKAFQRTVSIVRRQDKSDHWRDVRYVVFDAPEETGPFEDRLQYLADTLPGGQHEYAEVLAQQRCKNTAHLRRELARLESLGGEGLMLRQPGSIYEVGRSDTLLKVKSFFDAEATVIDHVPGKGRHKGRLGALVVQLDDGTEFSVGTGFSDRQRENPPDRGSLITFRYQELSNAGVPRFPSFLRAASASKSKASKSTSSRKASSKKRSTRPSKKPASDKKSSGTKKSAKTKYFELSDGKSNKFWEITIDDLDVTVRYGRIGSNGTSRTKTFGDTDKAISHAENLIVQKTGKGYVETTA